VATASAYSHDFYKRDQAEFVGAVYLFGDETRATDAWQRVRAHTPACYAQALAKVLVAANHDVPVHADLVFVRQARALTLAAYIGIDGQFDRALREKLTAAQAKRLT